MTYETENRLITEWLDECDPNRNPENSITFLGYSELAISDGFRMGHCRCVYNRSTGKVTAFITLDDDHAKIPSFFRDAVLWHEFVHYWDCSRNLHVDHCSEFQRLKWRKPLYALGDLVLKLIGFIWFD